MADDGLVVGPSFCAVVVTLSSAAGLFPRRVGTTSGGSGMPPIAVGAVDGSAVGLAVPVDVAVGVADAVEVADGSVVAVAVALGVEVPVGVAVVLGVEVTVGVAVALGGIGHAASSVPAAAVARAAEIRRVENRAVTATRVSRRPGAGNRLMAPETVHRSGRRIGGKSLVRQHRAAASWSERTSDPHHPPTCAEVGRRCSGERPRARPADCPSSGSNARP